MKKPELSATNSMHVTPDMIAAVEQSYRDLQEQKKELVLAKSAGIDTEDLEAQLKDAETKALAFLRVYRVTK